MASFDYYTRESLWQGGNKGFCTLRVWKQTPISTMRFSVGGAEEALLKLISVTRKTQASPCPLSFKIHVLMSKTELHVCHSWGRKE